MVQYTPIVIIKAGNIIYYMYYLKSLNRDDCYETKRLLNLNNILKKCMILHLFKNAIWNIV